VTNASSPIVTLDMLGDDVHVNAVGAVIPTSVEVAPEVFAGADQVVVDSISQVLAVSAEVGGAIDQHGLSPERLVALHSLVAARPEPQGGRTVFKSLGVGLADCAVAELAWRRARAGDG
jgi:ornithine cyclodeaminase/alanine dehydrogenase-like protein (mu-crystallin family)